MEKPDSILYDLVGVAYDQASLLYVLERLESSLDDEEDHELKLTVNGMKLCNRTLQRELQEVIDRLDVYIAESRRASHENDGEVREIYTAQ